MGSQPHSFFQRRRDHPKPALPMFPTGCIGSTIPFVELPSPSPCTLIGSSNYRMAIPINVCAHSKPFEKIVTEVSIIIHDLMIEKEGC